MFHGVHFIIISMFFCKKFSNKVWISQDYKGKICEILNYCFCFRVFFDLLLELVIGIFVFFTIS